MRIAISSLLCAATLLFASAQAQSRTASATSSASSAIPTGISSSCSTFLTKLNADASIKSCTAPLLSATKYYVNATSGAVSKTSASQALSNSLSQLCGTNAGCDSNLIKTYLSDFWNSCMSEIKSQNSQVLAYYDVLYLLNPFREAICSKDDSGNYCLTTVASTNTSSRRSLDGDENEQVQARFFELPEPLEKRQDSESVGSAASNATDSANLPNIAFLFLQPNADKSRLCSTCAQNILASYIKFETAVPYAIGLSNSRALSGQSALYKAAKSECGDKWAVKVNSVAGTTDFAKVAAAPAGAKASTALVIVGAGAAAFALLF